MKNLLLMVFVFFSMTAFSQDKKNIDWTTDLNFIKTELPKNHYNLYMVKSEQYFMHGIDQIAEQQNELSDFEVAMKLQQLIASMGDAHTALSLKPFLNFNKILPLSLMWFDDGIWIQATTKDNESILGSKLLGINDIPIHTVVDSLCTLFTTDNKATVKKTFPQLFPLVQLLEYFGFSSSDSVQLQLENNGEIRNYTILPERMNRSNTVEILPDPMPLCYQNGRAFFWDKVQKEDNVFYIQYNRCAGSENPPGGFRGDVQKLPSFKSFQEAVIDTILHHDFDKVIIDIRLNGGGNSAQGTEFVKELSTIEKINQKGKLYVIVGRRTFSSAIINAMDFKNMTKAILVGEETAGKPNHLGEVRLLKLPSSGMTLQYSTKYFKRTGEDLKTITPDQVVETNFNDFKEGRDPVYDWILKQ